MKKNRQLAPTRAADYEVGYAKPPQETQFKKGQSGNPAGRPKGAKNKPKISIDGRLKQALMKEAYREIPVNDGNQREQLTIMEAAIRSLGVKAAKGDHRSQKLLIDAVKTTEQQEFKLALDRLESAIEYKEYWEREIERCKRQGLEPPSPLPHPDHVHIDYSTGQIMIWGPVDKAEQSQFEVMILIEKRLVEAKIELTETGDPDKIADLKRLIKSLQKSLNQLMDKWRC